MRRVLSALVCLCVVGSNAPRAKAQTYEIKKGDSLSRIALKMSRISEIPMAKVLTQIRSLNPSIRNLNMIRVGQNLVLPDLKTSKGRDCEVHTVRKNQTLSEIIYYKLGGPVYGKSNKIAKISVRNKISDPDKIFPGQRIEMCWADSSAGPRSQLTVGPERKTAMAQPTLRRIEETTSRAKGIFSFSLGYSSLQYRETGIENYSSKAVTVKGAYQRTLFSPLWDFALNTFYTATTLSSTRPGIEAKYLGINFRVGYALPLITDPWRLGLMAGWYYTTMFVTNNAFGFQHLAGPQLFPVLKRKLGSRSSIYGYVKYSPMTNGLSLKFKALSNRELAAGGGYVLLLGPTSISAMIDYSQLSFTILSSQVLSNSLSFSLGIGF